MISTKFPNNKELGLVVTPPKTAEYIVSRLTPFNKEEIILDPCVGPGIFVETLLETGVDKKQIFSYDINEGYKSTIKQLGISFELKDYLLSGSPAVYNQFDVILGNPPYLNKASAYVRKNRTVLREIYGKTNAHETYSMFIVSSIWRLKSGGRLGFITSDSFLTLATHAKLRKFILDTCKIKEILLAPKNLFDNQDVSTSAAIIFLEKCSGKENNKNRLENVMRIVPRITTEDEYKNPPEVHKFTQSQYHLLPFNLFFVNVEKGIIELFEASTPLEHHIKGYIGMHTHDNVKYIAAIDGTELAEIFKKRNEEISNPEKKYKIITENELNSKNWKPYLKRGGLDQYYRPIMEALDWNPNSVKIYDIPKNVVFEKEGIVVSGVSSRLAARYMPKGCYWDSNKAIGFYIIDDELSIEYALGLLNSSLYNYLMKEILNNTNSIQISGIHTLPFVMPDKETKVKVERLVKKIIENKKLNLNYDYIREQKEIDITIFDFYQNKFKFKESLKKKLDARFSTYS